MLNIHKENTKNTFVTEACFIYYLLEQCFLNNYYFYSYMYINPDHFVGLISIAFSLRDEFPGFWSALQIEKTCQ